MDQSRPVVLAGGCQCGRVRYALHAAPSSTSICWCRTCQRALGSYVAPFTSVALADFAWTAGEPGVFRSSQAAERHFCASCGTPLTYRNLAGGNISVTTASFDYPERAPQPSRQYFPEHRPAFSAGLADLPEVETRSWITPDLEQQYASLQFQAPKT